MMRPSKRADGIYCKAIKLSESEMEQLHGRAMSRTNSVSSWRKVNIGFLLLTAVTCKVNPIAAAVLFGLINLPLIVVLGYKFSKSNRAVDFYESIRGTGFQYEDETPVESTLYITTTISMGKKTRLHIGQTMPDALTITPWQAKANGSTARQKIKTALYGKKVEPVAFVDMLKGGWAMLFKPANQSRAEKGKEIAAACRRVQY